MRLSELSSLLKEIHPIYLLCGSESLLIDRILKHLEKEVLSGQRSDFNYTVFYGSTTPVATVYQETQQIPFLSEKRLIIVKEVDSLSAEDQEVLLRCCEAPLPATVLVLVATSLDKRTRFYKTIHKKAFTIDCSTPPLDDLQNWVVKRCLRESKKISPEAVELLTQEAGASFSLLVQEVEKLLLFCHDVDVIELKSVESIFSQNKLKSAFEMWDAIVSRNSDEAYRILKQLHQDNISLPELMGLCRWQLSRLWEGRELVQSGKKSKKEIASTLHIPFFFVEKFLNQIKQFTEKRVHQAYEALLWADEKIKSGLHKNREIFDLLVFRLMK